MSYWESYWAAEDVPRGPLRCEADGPRNPPAHRRRRSFSGNGYAKPLLRAMTAFQFRHDETERVVTEPDVRNDDVIHVFERAASNPVREIAMDEKGRPADGV